MHGARKRWVLGAILAVSGLSLSWMAAGAATTLEGFTAVATAQSGRASFHVPGFAVVEEMADSGGPISQSAVDSSSAISFAAMPYPGDLVISGPGLFAGLSGLPSPGNYPFYVSASHPTTPEQSLGDPSGYQLLAKAAAGSTSGLAKAGGQGGEGSSGGSAGARSITSAVVGGDTVTVVGETINDGLNLGDGALRIASVRSKSVTTYRAGDAAPVTKTEFVVEGGSAGGSSFGYGPDGLVVAGSGVPIPTGSALEQLNKGLEPAGIQIRFVGAQPIVGGASADALEITLAGQAPIPGTPPGIIRLRVGGATSAVTVGTGGDGGLVPPVDGSVGGGDGVFPAPGGDSTGGTAAGDGLPASFDGDGPPLGSVGGSAGSGAFSSGRGRTGSAGSIGAALPVTGGVPGAEDATVSGEALPQVTTGLAQPILQPRNLGSDALLYWVLIGAGVVMLVLASLWRGKGVLSL
jgi:hypothetical protein